MGGSVAWTVRFSDSTEHRMERWTNIFPLAISDKFLEEDPNGIQEALASWLDMKADWEENNKTGRYRNDMTPVYAPYPYGFKPSEYGFIYTDFITKRIVSCQSYTDFTRVMMSPYMKKSFSEKYEWFEDLFAKGRISSYTGPDGEEIPIPQVETPEELLRATSIPTDSWSMFRIKPLEGWTILDFDPNEKAGRARAYAEVLSTGLSVTEVEIKAFSKWIKHG